MGRHGFSLVELMIVALLVSAIGLGISIYMKRSSVQLRSNDQSETLRTQVQFVENLLKKELQQIAFINPSCATNPPAGLSPSTDCSGVKIRAGFMPYPGETRDQMDARVDFALSNNLTASPSSLSVESDAARIVVFDFDGNYQCPLDAATPDNPSNTAFQMWADPNCTGLEVGRLYVLMENFNDQVFANVFQITALSGGGGSAYEITTATGGLYNQNDPLGDSLFSSSARIFPIKMVELAVGSDGGLFRREIRPTSSDLDGRGNWQEIQSELEGIQFSMITVTTAGVITHWRTFSFDGNSSNNGVEDVRGASPRIVLKSSRAHPEGLTFDNPLTAIVENDHFPRSEANFYVNFKNTNTN